MNIEISPEIFLQEAYTKINQQVMAKLHFRGLTANHRGNVIELPITTIRGCHYEIGFHQDCHEIALHFQGTRENNLYRSEAFRSDLPVLQSKLGHPLILGSHEGKDRKRLWIKLPIQPLTPELLEQYSDLTACLIILTLPKLQAIFNDGLNN